MTAPSYMSMMRRFRSVMTEGWAYARSAVPSPRWLVISFIWPLALLGIAAGLSHIISPLLLWCSWIALIAPMVLVAWYARSKEKRLWSEIWLLSRDLLLFMAVCFLVFFIMMSAVELVKLEEAGYTPRGHYWRIIISYILFGVIDNIRFRLKFPQ